MNYSKIKTIIKNEIKKIFDEEDKLNEKISKECNIKFKNTDKIEREMCIVEITENEEKIKYIQLRTDGQAYDLLYNSQREESGINLRRIENKINKEMGFEQENYFFDIYGQGILDYYC